MHEHWAVSVDRNGENILTIESNCLSGKPEFSDEDAQCIRDCAQQLLAFVGPDRRPKCQEFCPSWMTGHWRDWHRGHGCNLDDGKPRSAAGIAEIGTGRTPPLAEAQSAGTSNG